MERKKQNKALINKYHGQWLPFSDLPKTHKKALLIYSFGCDVQWKHLEQENIRYFLKEEKQRHGLYGIATIPMKVATRECLRFRDQKEHSTFEEYHKWYINYDPKDDRFVFHKDMWPLILSPFNDEWLQDGWHRFHSYYAQKRTEVPILMYPI